MKEKVTIRHAVSSHLRGIKELHKVSPKFFPLLTLHCFFSAIFPYISVFFSGQNSQPCAEQTSYGNG